MTKTVGGVWCVVVGVVMFASVARADDIAVRTVAYEASGQSFSGQVAVASVIKTRMTQRGQTARKVCLAPYQFSCWHPKTGAPTQRRELTQRELDTARRAWDLATVGRYNHYCAVTVSPAWISAAKSSLRIGGHMFYEL
jgi:N-acetylmuramoyl-L-alanine amidase